MTAMAIASSVPLKTPSTLRCRERGWVSWYFSAPSITSAMASTALTG